MSFTEFQYITQHDYKKALAMAHMNFSNEAFHILEISNEAHRLSFSNQKKSISLKIAVG